MPATAKVSYTLTPQTVAQIKELARLWSAAAPLPQSQVVSEAIRRAWAAEVSPKNGKKKS